MSDRMTYSTAILKWHAEKCKSGRALLAGLTDQGPGSRQGFPVLVLYGGRESLGLREGNKRCFSFGLRQWRHLKVCGDSQYLAVLCIFGGRGRYEQLSEVGTVHW